MQTSHWQSKISRKSARFAPLLGAAEVNAPASLAVDGINIATYKFFGSRGSGLAWLSDRAAALPHHKLAGSKKDYWDLGSSAPAQFAVVNTRSRAE
jgi:hypothetical protein